MLFTTSSAQLSRRQSKLSFQVNGKLLIMIPVAFLLVSRGAIAASSHPECQAKVSSICSREPLRSGVTAVLAVRMDGDTLVSVNPSCKLVPASTAKLITTGLALRALGPSRRFETRLAYKGSIVDSTLVGDLYIVGGGDPTLAASTGCAVDRDRTFRQWLSILRAAGISSVDGRIIGDPRYFDDPDPEGLGSSYEDIGTDYGAAPTGLSFNENIQTFTVNPGALEGSAPVVRPRYPETPWMKYANTAVTTAPRTERDMYYFNTRFGPYGQFAGKFPLDGPQYVLCCSNRFGAYTCAWYFYRFLTVSGVSVSGGFADVSPYGFIRTDLRSFDSGFAAPAQESLTYIGSTFSSTVSEIVKDTNFNSDNFYAETLLRQMGKIRGKGADVESCIELEEALVREMGLRMTNSCQLMDGSGLSRKNYIAPAFMVAFLRKMASTEVFGHFFASLPKAGQRGSTMETRLKSAPAQLRDRVHMKSGSMNGVRCFSGYIDATDGKPGHIVAFTVMTNNVTAGSYTVYPIIDEIIALIASEN